MSNPIHLTLTKFTSLDDFGTETESYSYGYRIYDNDAAIYNNTFSELKDLLMQVNEENFWKVLADHEEFEDIDPMDEGLFFNGTWYDGDEIADIAKEVDRRTAKRCED
jgi:hypothetical protein